MRIGDWKILATVDGPRIAAGAITELSNRVIKSAPLGTFELYNLKGDIGETTDLARQEPQRLQEMAIAIERMYRQVQADGPVWPVWQDPGYEAQRIEWPDYKALPTEGSKR